MQAAVRQAACTSQRGCGGLLQQAVLPALAFQLTSLASLTGLSSNSGGLPCRYPSPSAPAAASGGGAAGLLLPGHHNQQQQLQLAVQRQQRPFFDFAGLGDDLSKLHHEKKLLGWSPRQVYDVVAAVDQYHRFVPFCQRSAVLVQRGGPPAQYLEAELEVGFQVFVERYTSKVTLHCPTAVQSRVDDSTLFSHLTNKWEFSPGPAPNSTWLTFEVDFAFKSPLYRQVACIFFEEVVQRMMGAFEGRCAQMYGPSSLQHCPSQQVTAGGR